MEKVVRREILFTERLCTGISCNECSFNEVDGEPGCLLGKRIEELPFFLMPERRGWIPITRRPMTAEEREYYKAELEYYDYAEIFNCPLPDDE